MTLNDRRQFWADQIAAQKASGLNITNWCTEHKLNRRQFHYWMKHLEKLSTQAKKSPVSNWVRVNVESKQSAAVESALVLRAGSVAIEIKPGFNPSLLADVVRVLQTVC